MNMNPKLRPLWKRLLLMVAVSGVLAYKALRLPTSILPRDLRSINMRVIPTDVPAYTNKKYYRSVYQGGKYWLDKWGVALLRGEDRHQLSRTIPPAELERSGRSVRTAA